MNEHELEKLFENQESSLKFEKRIKRRINRHIYTKIILSILVICLMVVGGFVATDYILNENNYNPLNEEPFLSRESVDIEDFELHALMDFAVQINYPGVVLTGLHEENNRYTNPLGGGVYRFKGSLTSLNKRIVGMEPNITFEINRSQLNIVEEETDYKLVRHLAQFSDPDWEDIYVGASKPENVIKDIELLSESSMIEVALSFKEYQSLEAIANIIHEYEDSLFVWMAINNQNVSSFAQLNAGVGIYTMSFYELSEEAKKEYPDLFLSNTNISASKLRNHCLSLLKMMIDHPDFVSMYSGLDGDFTVENLKQRYQNAKESMDVYGLYAYMTKQDFIKIYESGILSYVRIEDVKLSRYSK